MEAFVKENVPLIQALYGDNLRLKHLTVQHFLDLLRTAHGPQFLIDYNFCPIFLQFADDDSHRDIQIEALRVLATFSVTATPEQILHVVELGIIPILLRLLRLETDAAVAGQAVKALRVIALDKVVLREFLLPTDVLSRLFSMIKENTNISILEDITWILTYILRLRPHPEDNIIRLVIPHLIQFLAITGSDDYIIREICWTLSKLVDDSIQVDYMIELGLLSQIVNIMKQYGDRLAVIHSSIRVLVSISAGDDDQTNAVVTSGALAYFEYFISCEDEMVVKDVCSTLSNITAGGEEQIQAIVDHNLILPLVECCLSENWRIRQEAILALINVSTFTDDYFHFSSLSHQDERHPCSPALLLIILDALKSIREMNRETNDIVYRQGIGYLISNQLIGGYIPMGLESLII